MRYRIRNDVIDRDKNNIIDANSSASAFENWRQPECSHFKPGDVLATVTLRGYNRIGKYVRLSTEDFRSVVSFTTPLCIIQPRIIDSHSLEFLYRIFSICQASCS